MADQLSKNAATIIGSTFCGDKMRWKEFLDTFVATVDHNANVTDIEKLNFCQVK